MPFEYRDMGGMGALFNCQQPLDLRHLLTEPRATGAGLTHGVVSRVFSLTHCTDVGQFFEWPDDRRMHS